MCSNVGSSLENQDGPADDNKSPSDETTKRTEDYVSSQSKDKDKSSEKVTNRPRIVEKFVSELNLPSKPSRGSGTFKAGSGNSKPYSSGNSTTEKGSNSSAYGSNTR